MGQQVRPGHAARDRTARRGFLHHLFAPATGFLDPGDLNDLHLGRDHIQQFADILAHHAQITTAIRAAGAGIKLPALARSCVRDPRPAAKCGGCLLIGGWLIRAFINGCFIVLSHCNQQVFQPQFQLFDLAFDLSEDLPNICFVSLAMRKRSA